LERIAMDYKHVRKFFCDFAKDKAEAQGAVSLVVENLITMPAACSLW
jgi:hypothetical protein